MRCTHGRFTVILHYDSDNEWKPATNSQHGLAVTSKSVGHQVLGLRGPQAILVATGLRTRLISTPVYVLCSLHINSCISNNTGLFANKYSDEKEIFPKDSHFKNQSVVILSCSDNKI